MSGLWDSMKNAGTRTKLQGEVMLHEREMKARKQRFGVDLFDLLSDEKYGAFVIKTPGIFHHNEQEIKQPYERCKNDIVAMHNERASNLQQVEMIQANKTRSAPAYTARDKMEKAGEWMSNTGQEGKLQTQNALLDRKIKARKQEFGIEIYDLIDYNKIGVGNDNQKSGGGGIKGAVANQLSKLSSKEKLIEECVEEVKKDVAFIQRRIQFKQDQIVQLGGKVKAEF